MTLARLRNSSPVDVAHYLSARGNFAAAPFRVGRFVLMSSRDSVGGGPYVIEEAWPLAGADRAVEPRGERPDATGSCVGPTGRASDCAMRVARRAAWRGKSSAGRRSTRRWRASKAGRLPRTACRSPHLHLQEFQRGLRLHDAVGAGRREARPSSGLVERLQDRRGKARTRTTPAASPRSISSWRNA